jgi:hypothetical protein
MSVKLWKLFLFCLGPGVPRHGRSPVNLALSTLPKQCTVGRMRTYAIISYRYFSGKSNYSNTEHGLVIVKPYTFITDVQGSNLDQIIKYPENFCKLLQLYVHSTNYFQIGHDNLFLHHFQFTKHKSSISFYVTWVVENRC